MSSRVFEAQSDFLTNKRRFFQEFLLCYDLQRKTATQSWGWSLLLHTCLECSETWFHHQYCQNLLKDHSNSHYILYSVLHLNFFNLCINHNYPSLPPPTPPLPSYHTLHLLLRKGKVSHGIKKAWNIMLRQDQASPLFIKAKKGILP